jgi:gamma-glutamyl:cysteine ligase YbdK (ATP-grasp superfamily)
VLDRIDELVIKPRAGYGGEGVVVAPHAEEDDVVGAETHACTLELATGIHDTVGAACAELLALRTALEEQPAPLGLHAPAAILALSANSPFWRARDSGMASVRTPLFRAFPRSGIPRRFDSYPAYVESIDVLLRAGAFPEPTFVRWDVRLQPRLGTVEVRIADAKTTVGEVAAVAALIRVLVRLEATERFAPDTEAVSAGLPHARDLGCRQELGAASDLAHLPGAERQRQLAADLGFRAPVEHPCGLFLEPAGVTPEERPAGEPTPL